MTPLRCYGKSASNNSLFTRRAGMQCCLYAENYYVTSRSDVTRKKFLQHRGAAYRSALSADFRLKLINRNASTMDKGASEDRLLGQKFIQALNNLLSTARIHQDNNRLLIECVESFIEIVGRLLQEEDEVTLLVSVGGFYLQQEKILFRRNAGGLVRKMLSFFEERQIDGLKLYQSVTYASLKDITSFARTLNSCARKEDPFHWLSSEMAGDRFPWVEVIDPSQTESLESFFTDGASGSVPAIKGTTTTQGKSAAKGPVPKKQESTNTGNRPARTDGTSKAPASLGPVLSSRKKEEIHKKKAMRTYGYAMNSLQNLSQKLSSDRYVGIGKAVHLVQNMVDLIMDDDNVLLGLSTIRDYDDYTFTHSVNVAILSVCLGNRIGLSRPLLSRLGLSGLFHDLGKIDVPKEILNKPGRLEDDEFAELQKHSLNSVRRIIRLRASYDKKANILLPPFEHHLKYDLSGYPKTPRKKPLSLLGRIVSIADVYDAITSQRIYRSRFLSPDQALGLILKGSGTDFDPILVKVFINMLGVYPLGTVLKFDDGEMGIVTNPPENAKHTSELWVMLLQENEDNSYTKLYTTSLGTWNADQGGFNRPILESCHPSELGIQPAELFF
ncbi:MAG TPA: HD domain-containing protein [Desulfobulbaceae bacterium]|nr:HD domain-containing protein [Desulfobulbaceae bacterium]